MAGIEDTIALAVIEKLKSDGTLKDLIVTSVGSAISQQTATLKEAIQAINVGGNAGNTGGGNTTPTPTPTPGGNTGGGTTTPGTGSTTPVPGNDGIADSGPLVSLNDFTNEDWERGILNHTYKAFTVKMDDVVKYGIGKGGVVRWTGNKQSVNVLSIEGAAGSPYATVRTDTKVDPNVVGYPGQIEVLRKGLSVAESPYDGSDPKKPTGSDSNTGGSTAPTTGTPVTTNPVGNVPSSGVLDGDFIPKQGSGLMCLNLGMGAGGDSVLPGIHGRNYCLPMESEIKRAVEKYNVRKFRIGFLWERIVKPGGKSELYLGNDSGGNPYTPTQMLQVLRWCKKYGATAMLDMHNYGGYSSTNTSGNRKKIGAGVSAQQWANDWCAFIRFLATDADAWSAIYGFDTMNEWESMTYATVKAACQTWLDVCAPFTGDKMCVFEGINFSSTRSWVQNNPDFYTLRHPRGKRYLEFSGHLYLDQDASGYYTSKGDTINGSETSSFAALAAQKVTFETVGTSRIAGFADWCKKNGVKGNIGENIVTGNLPNLLKGEARLLDFCIDAGIDVYVFGMGDWFGDNHHNIELGVNAPMLKLFTDRTAKQYK